MIVEKVLMLGERVDLQIGDLEYKSSLQDIIDDTTFLVASPLDSRNLPIHVDVNRRIGVIFYRDNGRFQFRAQILGRARIDNIALVRLNAEKGDPIKMQRRGSYRLPSELSVILYPTYETAGLRNVYHQHTIDISDGGMLVLFEKMIPLDTVFEMEFVLDEEDDELIEVRGSVRRIVPPDDHNGLWKIGIEFLDVSELTRRRISRFVLRVQAAIRAERASF